MGPGHNMPHKDRDGQELAVGQYVTIVSTAPGMYVACPAWTKSCIVVNLSRRGPFL
jgi:hypothetical protein